MFMWSTCWGGSRTTASAPTSQALSRMSAFMLSRPSISLPYETMWANTSYGWGGGEVSIAIWQSTGRDSG